jgi:putative hemin transport protein
MMSTTIANELTTRWQQFKAQNPKSRIREAAHQLGVSEVELLALGLGDSVTRLEGDFREILQAVTGFGKVMALTRNDEVVHERRGVYENVSFNGHVGLVLGPDIDLRLFMHNWKHAFAVQENDRFSLQFFDGSGTAVHKIYLTEQSTTVAYWDLVKKYQADDQTTLPLVEPNPITELELDDAMIDTKAFQRDWLDLQDTHAFFGLLKKYQLSRIQGLRLAPTDYALRIELNHFKNICETAAKREVPIMVFVSNRGCIQIHTGPIKRLVQTGPWFNMLDPDFNLHLREDGVGQIWITRKPTADGIVTGLELFDKNGEQIALFFGKRKPGIPEDQAWRSIVAESKS